MRKVSNFSTMNFIYNDQFEKYKDIFLNEPMFVVSGSQAMKPEYFQYLNNLHTITVNHLIEDWDGSEFFLYSDSLFTQSTTYDLSKYKGQILAKNNTDPLSIKLQKPQIRYKWVKYD